MQNLIRINLLQVLNARSFLIVGFIFILNGYVHVRDQFSRNARPPDLILSALGGIYVHDSIWDLLAWTSVVGLTSFFTYSMVFMQTDQFEMFTMLRAGSRVRWWLAKVLAIGIFTFLYVVIYVLAICAVGSLSSSLGEVDFDFVAKIVLVFWLGLFCIEVLVCTLAVLLRFPMITFMAWTILSFVLGQSYIFGKIPPVFSPMAFPAIRAITRSQGYLWSSVMTRSLYLSVAILILSIVGLASMKRIEFVLT